MDWQPIETLNGQALSAMFGRSEWVLVATSDGRVTEGQPYYTDDGSFLWMCSRGENCFQQGREPVPNMLRHHVTHWMPRPAPPIGDSND